MKPPKQEMKYERVPVYEEWITGKIVNIEYDNEHKFIWEGKENIKPGVRIIKDLEGCQYQKKSPWMAFSYSEKSKLYKTYILGLVENPSPNMDFDLDALKELPIKAMYSQNGEFDNLEMIRPLKAKVTSNSVPDDTQEKSDDIVPF